MLQYRNCQLMVQEKKNLIQQKYRNWVLCIPPHGVSQYNGSVIGVILCHIQFSMPQALACYLADFNWDILGSSQLLKRLL